MPDTSSRLSVCPHWFSTAPATDSRLWIRRVTWPSTSGARNWSSYPVRIIPLGWEIRTTLLDEIEEFLTGIRHGPEPDRILATVLFTDIVGSTKRAVELGDRDWRELLEQHHAIVRRQLARFRGHEVNIAGDGFLATFDGP